ncbi:hypothetical protein BDV25DRAFT_153080 [Aspergillus avenaceus]|uniref:Uncharacterized protein n=1 Tax=Aspergillus avenaceus TaxID=36643 RepID=A0A5N6TXV2_ASPAV|nr:hypothetical protein BDV25DRAFT_153080 [Aspergillus avenaceus]
MSPTTTLTVLAQKAKLTDSNSPLSPSFVREKKKKTSGQLIIRSFPPPPPKAYARVTRIAA